MGEIIAGCVCILLILLLCIIMAVLFVYTKKKKSRKTKRTTTYFEEREELTDAKAAKNIDQHIPSGSHSEYNDYASISDLVREGTSGSPPPLTKPKENLRSESLKKIREEDHY